MHVQLTLQRGTPSQVKSQKALKSIIEIPIMTNELICGLTPDQLNELKAKHGRLSLVTVTEGDDKYEGIFKEPTMDALSAITALSKQDEVKASLALFDNCLLSCDDAMKKRPRVRLSAIAQLSEIMKPLEGHIKNL